MPGGTYNPANGVGGYGSPLGVNRNPYEGGSINGPYPGAGGLFPGLGGGFPSAYADDSGKSVLLPLAGAALLGESRLAGISNQEDSRGKSNIHYALQASPHML
jgi:hypothetical protein